MRWTRRISLLCLAAALVGLAGGCATSEQQRYREHLGVSIKPSGNQYHALYASVNPD